MTLWVIETSKVYDYDIDASNEYGKIRSELEKNGKVIVSMDMLIAAHAKSQDVTLVTNNKREFKTVKGLNVKGWVKIGTFNS